MLCAVNVFLVFFEVKVRVYHRKYKDRNIVKLRLSEGNYVLITLLIRGSSDDKLLIA